MATLDEEEQAGGASTSTDDTEQNSEGTVDVLVDRNLTSTDDTEQNSEGTDDAWVERNLTEYKQVVRQLANSEKREIETLIDGGSIQIQRGIGIIRITGRSKHVDLTEKKLQTHLQHIQFIKEQAKLARLTAEYVQWNYQTLSGDEIFLEEYDELTNMTLEKAYRNKESKVKLLDLEGVESVVNLDKMMEYIQNINKDKVKVIRRELKTGNPLESQEVACMNVTSRSDEPKQEKCLSKGEFVYVNQYVSTRSNDKIRTLKEDEVIAIKRVQPSVNIEVDVNHGSIVITGPPRLVTEAEEKIEIELCHIERQRELDMEQMLGVVDVKWHYEIGGSEDIQQYDQCDNATLENAYRSFQDDVQLFHPEKNVYYIVDFLDMIEYSKDNSRAYWKVYRKVHSTDKKEEMQAAMVLNKTVDQGLTVGTKITIKQSIISSLSKEQSDYKNSTKSGRRPSHRSTHSPSVANSVLVAQPSTSYMGTMPPTPTNTDNPVIASQTSSTTSPQKIEARCFSYIGKALKAQGVPTKARELILQSWQKSTKLQYNRYVEQWIHFCGKCHDPTRANINLILKFLSQLFEKGTRYSALNTARSALSTFIKLCSNTDIHDNGHISRFMKGCFKLRPTLPKYTVIWDVDIVLRFFRQQNCVTLLQLSQKLCMLYLLVTAQRCQTLHLLNLNDVKFNYDKNQVTIQNSSVLKQSRPGFQLQTVNLVKFSEEKLCFVKCLEEYLLRTEPLRQSERLIISTMSPHKGVSRSTISRWIKSVMQKAGLGNNYAPHSTRAAATSRAKQTGVDLGTIIKTAGWSNAKTFARFYDKVIENPATVQKAIMAGN